VFSVRVRDRGPDYRTFVRIGVSSANAATASGGGGGGDDASSGGSEPNGVEMMAEAKCFVETCTALKQQVKMKGTNRDYYNCVIKKCGWLVELLTFFLLWQTSPCNHILAARRCFSSSHSLPVKMSSLTSGSVPDEFYGVREREGGKLYE
jgi:hypothetical protein